MRTSFKLATISVGCTSETQIWKADQIWYIAIDSVTESVKITPDTIIGIKMSIIWSYFLLSLVMLLCLVVNLKVIYTVIVSLPQRRKKLVSLLIAQLSLISIGNLAVAMLNICDRVGLINQRGQLMCCVMGFLRTTLPCAFSTNMAAIIYERVRKFSENHGQDGQIIISRLFALVWILPIIQGVPSSVMTTYIDDPKIYNLTKLAGNCLPVPLLGNDYITLINEGTRCMVFHMGVCGYMVYALCKTRSKLHYLTKFTQPNSTTRLRRKLSDVRFMYCHFVFFISFWIPTGILFLVRRTLKRVGIFGDNASQILPEHLLNKCSGLILMMYFTVYPVVNLYLLDNNMFLLPKWCCRFVVGFEQTDCGTEETTCEMHEIQHNTVETGRVTANKVEVESTYHVSSREIVCVGEQVATNNEAEQSENVQLCSAEKCAKRLVKVIQYEPVLRETLI